jgi:hypothetical protein
MALIKRLKNNTDNDLNILNQTIGSGEYLTVQYKYWAKVSNDVQNEDVITQAIINGDIIVNDGTNDLSISEGLVHLKRWEDSETINKTSDMTVHFGANGSLKDKYLQVAGGSKTTSDETTIGFPRPIKIVGYFIDSEKNPNREWIIRIREKTNLGINKASITKPSGQLSIYSYDLDNPLTTFTAGDRMSVFVEEAPGPKGKKANSPKITFWFRWND